MAVATGELPFDGGVVDTGGGGDAMPTWG